MNATEKERVRAFLAVEMGEEIHAALVALKAELERCGAAVRWVGDQGLHATVKFLGSVHPEILTAARDSLTEPLSSFSPFPVHVAGLGVFPNLRRPRVLWVGLRGRELAELARSVEAALGALGFSPERRSFEAHITLGRVKGTRRWSNLEEALKSHWTDDFGVCNISELVAYRSDLHPHGAVYTKLWTIPLAGRTGGEDHGTRRES